MRGSTRTAIHHVHVILALKKWHMQNKNTEQFQHTECEKVTTYTRIGKLHTIKFAAHSASLTSFTTSSAKTDT